MFIILMGVSGCGKTSVGKTLASHLSWTFHDADDFHSTANKTKMASGVPLTDEDREPWLESLAHLISSSYDPLIIGCSALKRRYREKLRVNNAVVFVYLKGSEELIRGRLEQRQGHYFSSHMLESQFEALEEPLPDEGVVVVNVDGTVEALVASIRKSLNV